MVMLKEYGNRRGIGLCRKAQRRHDAGPSDVNVTEGWIAQDLDHFNSSNFDTWKQRFFYTEKFYQPGGPLFLILAGEWEESVTSLAWRYPAYLEYAESHHAAVYLLEHRYYGHSIPLDPNATDAADAYYRYLSSEQALADAAQFVETINRYKGYEDPKWVSFGCSYAGVLSAWFRQAYPSLVVGAVASSAPVQAKVDFYESYQVVQANLELYGDCERNVRTAVREVYELAQTEAGRAKLNQTFGRVQSASGIPGILLAGYRENGYYKRTCSTMNNSSRTPLQNLAALLGHKSSLEAVGYDNVLHQLLRSEKRWDREVVRMRAWAYQTCAEFGFFFSTDYGNGTFASLVPVNGKVETCIELYGAVPARRRVDEAVARTNLIHGGATNYNGTNVVFFNGGADLWYPLSVLTNRTSNVDGSAEVTSFLVPEQPHCQDMYKDPNDPPQLIEARKRTDRLIGEWIH